MDALLIVLRLVHVVAGSLWVGFAVFMAFVLAPALEEAGPDAGKVMGALQRGGITTILPVLALAALLSGVWLYWRVSGGFARIYLMSATGHALGLGGVAAIVAFVVGMVVSRPAMLQAAAAMQAASTASNAEERERLMATVRRLRTRGAAGTRAVAILVLLAVAGMAVGRYL